MTQNLNTYAYLKQEDAAGLPRLVQRYQLSYPVSMLLVQLRKALGEQDTASGDTRLVISFADIMRRMEPFLPVPGNEMKFRQSLEHTIGQVVQLGFLQKLKGSEDEYEVRPVLRSFVDAQWLSDFNEKLAEYEALVTQADAALAFNFTEKRTAPCLAFNFEATGNAMPTVLAVRVTAACIYA